MNNAIVAICPSCSQKYRVPKSNVGMRARCKGCGQPFKILDEPPIDDETIFGWVTEDDPLSSSVLGGTGLFGQTFHESTHVPVNNRWVHPAPPDLPRVDFTGFDDEGAHFTFSSRLLSDRDLRCSFPHRCAQCLIRDQLEMHLIVWREKVPGRDAAMINETETRTHRKLDELMKAHELNWFDALEPIETMPAPFKLPFAYCTCPHCSVIGAVRGRVHQHGNQETCEVIVAHPSIALDFYRNNGGRNTPGYKRLLVASRQRRDNQWKSLAVGVRIKLGEWFKPAGGENFLGYYADRDFDQSDRGMAGVVLTDKRLVYKKYAALREYCLDQQGILEIEATPSIANIDIHQNELKVSTLATTPLAASSLARTLSGMSNAWKINVETRR
ncbi:MAG: hypothetical protein GXP29_05485 [Planctomycetes bacterium]|nr:hypothetical protein [Planctomycetota bacterium]